MPSLKYLLPLLLIGLTAFLLRTHFIAQVPTSPYWEETILGYDAYSLSETGKDHHGQPLPILAAESFGDWKPTGYIYAAVPFVKMFGLELWVIRLPSMLAGLALVAAVAVLAAQIAVPRWMGALVVVVAPWAIHFSRAAWEAHLATALIAWAMIFALSAIRLKKLNLLYSVLSVLFFIFAWYTYHAARLIVPLLGIGVLVYAFVLLKQYAADQNLNFGRFVASYLKKSWLVISLLVVLVVLSLLPLLSTADGKMVTQRFNETSRFSDSAAVFHSNTYREMAGNTLIAKLIYHRYVIWGAALLTAYADNLNPSFLFLNGETNLRHTTAYFGLFYSFEIIFLVIGLYVWSTRRTGIHLLFLYWLAVSLIPSALSTPTPHGLRILIGLPVFALLISQGLNSVSNWLISRFEKQSSFLYLRKYSTTFVFAGICLLYAISVAVFWFNYTQVYPIVSARQWQDGYREMFEKLAAAEAANPTLPVYISRTDGRPAAFLWFYRKTDPRMVQQADVTALKDQGEFLEFQHYHFVRSPGQIPDEKALVVLTDQEFKEYQERHAITQTDVVVAKNGETVWILGQQ